MHDPVVGKPHANTWMEMPMKINGLTIKILNRVRRMLGNGIYRDSEGPFLPVDYSGEAAGHLIYDHLMSSQPCMVARFGRSEMITLRRAWFGRGKRVSAKVLGFLRGDHGPFWWEQVHLDLLHQTAGVFPRNVKTLRMFSQRYFEDMQLIDVLGSLSPGEADLAALLHLARVIPIADMEPFWAQQPWTRALQGKVVLVIHPFDQSIKFQYTKRESLFRNSATLPLFELRTLRPVWSAGGQDGGFRSWSDALDWMCGQMETIEFDVALIGAGAYGLPLAAHAKRMGRKAVHLGGALQLLFGIKGKRWDSRTSYQNLYNEHWMRPMKAETPASNTQVEGGCYW